MPTALEQLFIKTKSENRAALIGYLPAGFPTQKESKLIVKAMIDGGVDAIEIGYPYSDPIMDGPVIQAASEQAISNGAGVEEVFDLLKISVGYGVPSVVMSYWSPIEKVWFSKICFCCICCWGFWCDYSRFNNRRVRTLEESSKE